MARKNAAPARDVLSKRGAAPLMVRVLGREGERAVAGSPWRVGLAVEFDAARVRGEHAREQLEECRLARAVCSGQPIDLTRLQHDIGLAKDIAPTRIAERHALDPD